MNNPIFVFAYFDYSNSGGMNDLVGTFEDIEAAEAWIDINRIREKYDNVDIEDITKISEVFRNVSW